jgi:hypothetical protein|tara:strand:- start:1570 stop:2166 length:597 start_codon:yes stop_codon:yes gene_type:complete
MSVKKYKIKICDRKSIKNFVETWHYSKNINGLKSNYCFGLFDNKNLIGVIMYGQIAMANVWKKYVKKENDLIELRRLCCIDDTPKNTESYFIGFTLRWLKKNTTYSKVISYADKNYNHIGIVYKASNFQFQGMTNKGRVIVYDKKIYHDKTIRTKYKGKLKPYAQKIKQALKEGKAYYKNTVGKNIYIYNLRKKENNQ